jgi:microcystin-dependent protein
MAKTKISEYDATAANNTDVDGINIAESCPPSGINNAIREVMAHLKDFQSGTSGDTFTNTSTLTSSGTLAVTGNFTLDGSAGTSGQVIVSAGTGTPTWGNAFFAGMIMMWSGSIASIPSGWYLCDGTNGTPDLRNKMIVAADADDGGVAKSSVTGSATQSGGSKDAIIPSHSHTFSGTVEDRYLDQVKMLTGGAWATPITVPYDGSFSTSIQSGRDDGGNRNLQFKGGTRSASLSGTTSTAGTSVTNANLPPYYALAFIMKG